MSEKIRAYFVVGDGSSGKSSTIRALTGAHGRTQPSWIVAFENASRETYVQLSALQEQDILPCEFLDRVKDSGLKFVIAALRKKAINRRTPAKKTLPDGDTYLEAFRSAGWSIETHPLQAKATPPQPPANSIAADLRRAWRIK